MPANSAPATSVGIAADHHPPPCRPPISVPGERGLRRNREPACRAPLLRSFAAYSSAATKRAGVAAKLASSSVLKLRLRASARNSAPTNSLQEFAALSAA